MSMPVNGGGGVRPLLPVSPQQPTNRPDDAGMDQLQERFREDSGRSMGPVLRSINQFNTTSIEQELNQVEQWSHTMKTPDARSSTAAAMMGGRAVAPVPIPVHGEQSMDVLLQAGERLNISPAQSHDLGRMLDGERSHLMGVAEQMGIPREAASEFLREIARTGQRFDIPPQEMQAMMEARSQHTDGVLMEAMREGGNELGIPPRKYMAMGNALMNNDVEHFMNLGQKAGLGPEALDHARDQIKAQFEALEARSEIGGEKITRMVMDDRIKNRIAAAGKQLGIEPQQSLRMAFTFIEEGPDGLQKMANEQGMGQTGEVMLTRLEQIKEQASQEVLSRGVDSFRDVREQHKMASELGLHDNPMNWRTSESLAEQAKAGFAFMKPMGRMMQAVDGKDFNEIRHHKMQLELAKNSDQLQALNDGKDKLFSPQFKHKADQKIEDLGQMNQLLMKEMGKMESEKVVPSADRQQQIALASQADETRQQIAYLSKLSEKIGDDDRALHGARIDGLKKSFREIDQQLMAFKK